MPIPADLYRKVVIDTSPLVDVLLIDWIAQRPDLETSITREFALERYLQADPVKQQRLIALVEGIQEIVISSHVIGEIKGNRYSQDLENLRALYWEHCLDFFDRHAIREEQITFAELGGDETTRRATRLFGPTDAGLMKLANKEKCYLLTNDGHWFGWQAAFAQMEIRLVEHLLD